MKFRVFSDIHQEFQFNKTRLASEPMLWNPQSLESDKDTVLILAGDLWLASQTVFLAKWLNDISVQFKSVVVVLGNHDYWHSQYWPKEPYNVQSLVADNVFVLEKEVINIDGVSIGGATLWTDLDNFNPLKMLNARSYTNDFKFLKGMDPEKWVQEYAKTLGWIKSTPVDLLVTHYVPNQKFIHPRFIGDSVNCAFSSNCAERVDKLPKVWVFGHTHDNFDEEYLGTRFICNPKGYGTENREFKEDSLYEL